MTTTCPCGLGRPYDACCGPLHRGEARAETAEALMRSRYAAFAVGEAPYLVATLHPSRRTGNEGLAEGVVWTGLTVLDTAAGGPADAAGVVEFEARYLAGGRPGAMRERSRFVREDGAWYYVDGEHADRPLPTRGGACPCGSGRKYKRCCGAG